MARQLYHFLLRFFLRSLSLSLSRFTAHKNAFHISNDEWFITNMNNCNVESTINLNDKKQNRSKLMLWKMVGWLLFELCRISYFLIKEKTNAIRPHIRVLYMSINATSMVFFWESNNNNYCNYHCKFMQAVNGKLCWCFISNLACESKLMYQFF